MKYKYPAIFTPLEEGQYDVNIPDLPYCRTCGHNLEEAVEMAEDATAMWLWDAENKQEDIPSPSIDLPYEEPQFIIFIETDTDKWRQANEAMEIEL